MNKFSEARLSWLWTEQEFHTSFRNPLHTPVWALLWLYCKCTEFPQYFLWEYFPFPNAKSFSWHTYMHVWCSYNLSWVWRIEYARNLSLVLVTYCHLFLSPSVAYSCHLVSCIFSYDAIYISSWIWDQDLFLGCFNNGLNIRLWLDISVTSAPIGAWKCKF